MRYFSLVIQLFNFNIYAASSNSWEKFSFYIYIKTKKTFKNLIVNIVNESLRTFNKLLEFRLFLYLLEKYFPTHFIIQKDFRISLETDKYFLFLQYKLSIECEVNFKWFSIWTINCQQRILGNYHILHTYYIGTYDIFFYDIVFLFKWQPVPTPATNWATVYTWKSNKSSKIYF